MHLIWQMPCYTLATGVPFYTSQSRHACLHIVTFKLRPLCQYQVAVWEAAVQLMHDFTQSICSHHLPVRLVANLACCTRCRCPAHGWPCSRRLYKKFVFGVLASPVLPLVEGRRPFLQQSAVDTSLMHAPYHTFWYHIAGSMAFLVYAG